MKSNKSRSRCKICNRLFHACGMAAHLRYTHGIRVLSKKKVKSISKQAYNINVLKHANSEIKRGLEFSVTAMQIRTSNIIYAIRIIKSNKLIEVNSAFMRNFGHIRWEFKISKSHILMVEHSRGFLFVNKKRSSQGGGFTSVIVSELISKFHMKRNEKSASFKLVQIGDHKFSLEKPSDERN